MGEVRWEMDEKQSVRRIQEKIEGDQREGNLALKTITAEDLSSFGNFIDAFKFWELHRYIFKARSQK